MCRESEPERLATNWFRSVVFISLALKFRIDFWRIFPFVQSYIDEMDLDRALEDEYLRIRYKIKLSDRVRELISHSSDDASMVLNHLFNRKNSKKSMLPAENELNRCNWFVRLHFHIFVVRVRADIIWRAGCMRCFTF